MASNSPSVPSNVYTVLTVVAFLVLAVGIGFVIYKSTELFGTWNPGDAPENLKDVQLSYVAPDALPERIFS